MSSLLALCILSILSSAFGGVIIPRHASSPEPVQLSAKEMERYAPYAHLSSAAYCPPHKIQQWQCGEPCKNVALHGENIGIADGNGASVQNFFVAWWPAEKSVVVSYEGTDPTKLEAILTDVKLTQVSLEQSLFPNAPDNVRVHEGFHAEFTIKADEIRGVVQKLLNTHKGKKVVTTGHSLGGALAMLAALSLRLRLPPNVHVSSVTFAAPRVGNPEFSVFFNSHALDLTRVNHGFDMVGVLPLEKVEILGNSFLPFRHAGKSEVRFYTAEAGATKAVRCESSSSGEENHDALCLAGAVKCLVENCVRHNVVKEHLGPFAGVTMPLSPPECNS